MEKDLSAKVKKKKSRRKRSKYVDNTKIILNDIKNNSQVIWEKVICHRSDKMLFSMYI